jgi:ribonuclease/clavin/mitogillin
MSIDLRATAQGEPHEFDAAAAVLLTRVGPGGLELYLVRRSPHLRSFPDTWALPGGGADAVDGDPGRLGLGAYARCALRELFEETGVAGPGIAPLLGDPGQRADLRRGLGAVESGEERRGAEGERQWAHLLSRAVDPAAGLVPFCWTTTPRFALRRYRALYLWLELPPHEAPTIVPGELVEGRFETPAQWRREWRAGRLPLVPPLVFLLEALERCGDSLEPALRAAGARSDAVDDGGLHAVFPVPGFEVAPLRSPTIPPATTTNCVLVGTERLFVVDPATYDSAEREALAAHLEGRRAAGAELAGVIVSHHHPDHVGAVQFVAERFGLPVLGTNLTLSRLPEPPRRGRELTDGERLALGSAPDGTVGWELEALHTPGLVFRESRYGNCVAADLVSTLSTIVIDPPEGHLATYLASLRRVLDRGCGALIPAHGSVAHDGPRLLRTFLRHRELRETQLLGALSNERPRSERELLPEVYFDLDPRLVGLAGRSLRAGLDKLAEEGRARAVEGGWVGGANLPEDQGLVAGD